MTSNVQVVKLDGKGKRSKAASKAARWIGEDGQEIVEDREGEFVEGLEGRGGREEGREEEKLVTKVPSRSTRWPDKVDAGPPRV